MSNGKSSRPRKGRQSTKRGQPKGNTTGKGDYNVKTQPGIIHSLKPIVSEGLGLLGDGLLPGSGALARMIAPKAMDLFSKITGFGDYTLEQNSLVAHPEVKAPPPVFGDGSIREKGSEFVGIINTAPTSDFRKLDHFLISPSNPKLFPKFSQKAALFQKNVIHGLIFRFESLCSESFTGGTSNMAIPNIAAVTSYDVTAEDPVNLSEVLNTFFNSGSRVNKDFLHPVECDPKMRTVTVLDNWSKKRGETETRDARFSNLGNLILCGYGGQQSSPFPAYKMFVEYDIELIMPIIRKGVVLSDMFKCSAPETGKPLAGVTMDSDSTEYGYPEKPYDVYDNTIVFSPYCYGDFEITVLVKYTSGASTVTLAQSVSGNAAYLNYYDGDSTYYFSNYGESSLNWINSTAVRVTGGGTITISNIPSLNWKSTELLIHNI